MVNEKGSVNLNNDEIDIIDLLKLLYRHKVFIVIVTVLFAAAGFGVSKILPQKWTSTAEVTATELRDMPELDKVRQQMNALNVTAVSDLPAAFNVFGTVIIPPLTGRYCCFRLFWFSENGRRYTETGYCQSDLHCGRSADSTANIVGLPRLHRTIQSECNADAVTGKPGRCAECRSESV